MMEEMKIRKKPVVDVIIPVYKPDEKFYLLLKRLGQQTLPVNKVLVINTEERYWKTGPWETDVNLEVDKMAAAAVCVGTVLFLIILLLQKLWKV